MHQTLSTWRVARAVEALREGRFVCVFDGEARENEGDLCVAAEHITPEAVAFMARHARGLICAALSPRRCDELQLGLMPQRGRSLHAPNFTISVDARDGISTGISASDRARTIQICANREARADALVRPGHVFPLRAADGGCLARRGHAEAATDLARLAGLQPAAATCEAMGENGNSATREELRKLCRMHGIPLLAVDDVVRYREATAGSIVRGTEGTVFTEEGTLHAASYLDPATGREHVALVIGDVSGISPAVIYVHRRCPMSGILRSFGCDCAPRGLDSLERVRAHGLGAVIYLASGAMTDCHVGYVSDELPTLPLSLGATAARRGRLDHG